MARQGGQFGHIKTTIVDGIRFRSAYEAGLYKEVIAQGETCEYETESIPYVTTHKYTADFKLTNGILIEAKGRLLKTDRSKMIAVKKQNPHLDIRFVFQNANGKATPTQTNGQWAESNGFKWAHKTIPLSWFKE